MVDGTLVYLWLRPMDRLPVVIGAFFASITVSLPLTVVPMAIAAAVGGSGSDVIATVVASGVGVLGYSALFVLLGLLVKNAIIWGLAYVLLWEGQTTQFSSAIGRVSVRGYLRAIVDNMAGVRLNGALDIPTLIAVIVCLGIVVAGSLGSTASPADGDRPTQPAVAGPCCRCLRPENVALPGPFSMKLCTPVRQSSVAKQAPNCSASALTASPSAVRGHRGSPAWPCATPPGRWRTRQPWRRRPAVRRP